MLLQRNAAYPIRLSLFLQDHPVNDASKCMIREIERAVKSVGVDYTK